MWDKYNEDREPRTDIGRIVRISVFAALGVIIFAIVSNQSVTLLMNAGEFGDLFAKPFYYAAMSGLVLAAIALVRVNFAKRRSVVWYGFRVLVNFLKRGDFESQPKSLRYSEFKMSTVSFVLWQLTKVVLFAPLFASLLFGMAADYTMKGNDIGLGSAGNIFTIPFANVPADGEFARQQVLPMAPALTLLILPLLGAVQIRLMLYVGVAGTVGIVSQYMADAKEGKPKFLSYISTIEIIVGVAIFWVGFAMFFDDRIDYNTRFAIAGTIALGATLIAYGFLDRSRAKVIIYPTKRHMYSRLVTVAAIVVAVGATMAVNNSIADAKKVEVYGPYVAQEIAVNRHMAGLDGVSVVDYDPGPQSVAASSISSIVSDNSEILGNVRLWDRENALARLKPELGQRSDILYTDTDVLRFGGTSYWAGTTAPVIPDSAGNAWFAQHILYTHANTGIKMFEADTGKVADESSFFGQTRIYYGESGDRGLFDKAWSAYPAGRTSSDEIDKYLYNGTGGVDVSPPLSWMFEPNFMVSYPGTPIHVMRYKDIHERMELLYPYFVYEFEFGDVTNPQKKKIDAFPVTDGKNTYWLMPLVVALDTKNVQWSSSFALEHVGYALIDSYNGSVQVIVTGDGFFSEMFLDQYGDAGATREVPEWLAGQIKYPEEMFLWQVSRFHKYHVTDPKAFIESKEIYSIPDNADSKEIQPYYTIAQPQGFAEPEFVGVQLLTIAGSDSKSLAGYMVVENDLQDLGKMTFYSASGAQLAGPKAAEGALVDDAEYKKLKNPKLGENILYDVGGYPVYFIPAFTGAEGQLGAVGAVGTNSNTQFVGLGSTPAQAFENYLQKLSGVVPPAQPPANTGNQTEPGRELRIAALEKIFADAGFQVVKPTTVSAPIGFMESEASYRVASEYAGAEQKILAFIDGFITEGERVFEWRDGGKVNFGVLREVDGITESHYISINAG